MERVDEGIMCASSFEISIKLVMNKNIIKMK